ncbi:mycothiol synthase [Cryobacterium sp. BB307]|uniref:mycothiol synthase n=1 Tax=Cryobacterium sp. BB307 TaxID=2716317 RepID=UPI0014467D69|nr:mycothiol synthase [Cryobacterium sp. BB307]
MRPDWFDSLVRRAAEADGQPPFSDQALIDLDAGDRQLIAVDDIAVAIHSDHEFELVVDPDARRRGHGKRLTEQVLAETEKPRRAWAHGDHPASHALAQQFGFDAVRTLLQLRAGVGERAGVDDDVRAFRPGTDDEAWLALNAKAFAEHPEQGKLTQDDLDARKAEPWFDADDFLLLWDGAELTGFAWLKVPPGAEVGEFYAVGVDPALQGQGIGARLMDAGFARLSARGIRTASLYVEGDNSPALKLYGRYGFGQHTIDVQYERVL